MSIQQKKRVDRMIKKISDEKVLEAIWEIMKKDPNLKYTDNYNGVWIRMNCFSKETINEMEKFLNEYHEKNKNKTMESYTPYHVDEFDEYRENNTGTLSKYDKHAIKSYKNVIESFKSINTSSDNIYYDFDTCSDPITE